MADKEIKITFPEKKMEALVFFLGEQNEKIEDVLTAHLDKTYEKYVPQQVRKFVESQMAVAQEEAPVRTPRAQRQTGESGEPVRRNKEKAYKYFMSAAEQGNVYAAYFLEHWNDMPHPDLFLMASRLMHQLGHIIEEDISSRKRGGNRAGIDRKLARKIREKKVAQGHAEDDKEMVQIQ